MTDQQNDGDTKAIEWTSEQGFRLRLRVFLADADNKGSLATEETLAAAGYVPASELEAVRLELGLHKRALLDHETRLEAERGRAEEAERNVLAERTMAKTAERLLDEVKAKLGAANTRVGRLEETVRAAKEMRSWYDKQMGPDGPEVAFDVTVAALSAAPQASTEQTCGAVYNDETRCDQPSGHPGQHVARKSGLEIAWGDYNHEPIPRVAQTSGERRSECPHGVGLCTATCPSKVRSKPPEALTVERMVAALRATAEDCEDKAFLVLANRLERDS